MKPSRASPPWLGLIGSLKNRKSRNERDVLYINCTHYPFFCNSMSRSRTWSLKYHTSQKPAPSGEFLEGAVLSQRKSTVLYFDSRALYVTSLSWIKVETKISHMIAKHEAVCQRQTQSQSFFSVTFTVLNMATQKTDKPLLLSAILGSKERYP